MSKDVTDLLIDLREGEKKAIDKLFPVVYEHMRVIAGFQLNKEYNSVTIQQTELVHEAFLKMVDQTRIEAVDRNHFYNIAAQCMRQVLVDYARKKNAEKRGGKNFQVTMDENILIEEKHLSYVIETDKYLEELRNLNERMGQVVEMKFFGGLTNGNIADVLGVSKKTVIRDWTHAKGWLQNKIKNSDLSQ